MMKAVVVENQKRLLLSNELYLKLRITKFC